MSRWLVSTVLAVSLLSITQSANAQDIRPELADLSKDWTNLSPRVQCLERGGLKDKGHSTYSVISVDDPKVLFQVADRDLAMWTKSLNSKPYNPGWEHSEYRDRLSGLYSTAGLLAAAQEPDTARIRRVLYIGASAPIPTIAQGRQDNFNLHQALIKRACAEEYFAAAFGVGEKGGLERYKKARSMWIEDPEKWKVSGTPTYYPRELVALNYLTSRELLLDGRLQEAYALSNDPVMQWAIKNLSYATNFAASFHQLGIGTPRSPEKALAIFQAGGAPLDIVAGASIKASLGRRNEAIADLQKILKEGWEGDPEYIKAKPLFAALSGRAYVEPPKPGFMDMVIMIPLAILSYCATLPNGCPAGQGGSLGSQESSLDRQLREDKQRMQNMQQYYDWTSIGKPDY